MRSARLPHLGYALALGAAVSACSDPAATDLVWPTSGTPEPQRLSSSFGPRVRGANFDTYDFHRGIDIPVAPGTPVYAAAAGEVKRAGDDPGYTDRIVQIEHCDGSACFYTNYMHLTAVTVSIGQKVEQGELVALSGFGETGFPHLHFEVREDRPEQDHCVHPLHRLPTPSWLAPHVTLSAIDGSNPASPSVEATVTVPGIFPTLLRVELSTRDGATGAALDERTFDVDEWTRKYSPADDPDVIDDPDLEGIHVDPGRFNEETEVYTIRLRFGALQPASAAGALEVTARAVDVHGNVDTATAP
ncbi:MAG: M23 family metallopeptidase [Polyangiaceae bacterium]|nr:M23 family metallopeptidase [Polyangiaceae bacterium]